MSVLIGYGLKNIAATVQKYHGEYYMESMVENGEAMFKIGIAIPKDMIPEEDRV